MPDTKKRAAPRQKSLLPIALLILIMIIGLGLLLWFFALTPRQPAVHYEPPGAERPDTPALITPEPTGPERRPAAPLPLPAEEPDECQQVSDQIQEFFAHLDRRGYIGQRELPTDSLTHFKHLTERLLANPPAVSGETDDIYTVLSNTAHLYRMLGLKDLWLLKEVIQEERADLENILALLYRWSIIAEECQNSSLQLALPLPALYEYAGFFLNTLGGRSYLFRRDTRIRLLTTYYSVLILDRANEEGINRHGLDIRPAIGSLLAELPAAETLRQREEYLGRLLELQNKYRRKYGASGHGAPYLAAR
ncbi:hypothetical protein [Desulfurivibrio dismutans]|uniref:hypothetical protein n=1 Tax=Desulfurivibrio dismutans TaxID=1398908 RepID=UPI0023DCD36B|nr:hypothetical protein [Desulfurivibrio alkaliphilus]MDF1613596.1 hypothetical protein [Desulfurivibrio alkaliphilus]